MAFHHRPRCTTNRVLTGVAYVCTTVHAACVFVVAHTATTKRHQYIVFWIDQLATPASENFGDNLSGMITTRTSPFLACFISRGTSNSPILNTVEIINPETLMTCPNLGIFVYFTSAYKTNVCTILNFSKNCGSK